MSDMKIRNVLMAIFLLSLANTVILPILAQDEAVGVTSKSLKAPSNETELAAFVEFAASYARDVGKYEAIKDYMDLNGSWVRGDIYIFAHDFNGTSLCLPYMPKEVGTDKNSENATIGTDNDMAYFLLQLQASIQGQLNDLDSVVADSSYQLSATGIEGEKARDILRNLTGSSPYFTEATTGSPEGKIAAAEPAVYRNLEGADISKNDATIRLMQTKSPVFSPVFHLVEGYDASIVSYPVFSAPGEFIGGVGAIIKPADLLGSIIAPRLLGTNYSVTVMQKDGLSLYDSDPSQVGKNLFSDPIYQPYPQLLALGKNVVAERSGMGRYVFQNNEHNGNISKEVYWTSVGLHGNEWRLVAIRATR